MSLPPIVARIVAICHLMLELMHLDGILRCLELEL
jgi:hypothetical protein